MVIVVVVVVFYFVADSSVFSVFWAGAYKHAIHLRCSTKKYLISLLLFSGKIVQLKNIMNKFVEKDKNY